MEKLVIIAENDEDMRLDVYLSKETEFTRSYIDKLNKAGCITVGGEKGKSGKILKNLDVIEITLPDVSYDIQPEDIPLDVLYEDCDLVVINKRRGVSAHPSGNIVSGTLVNALLFHIKGLSGISGEIRPGIVHRLDKDTTGVMIVAKNDKTHVSLSSQFAARAVKKIYHGILEGNLKDDSGRITTGIGRHPKNRKLMSVISGGKEAVTRYKVLERFESNCLAEFDLLTGRTHQIRVHAKHLGHPLVGDPAYGFLKQRFRLDGQLLHSYQITFTHPISGEIMTFTAPYPCDFTEVLKELRCPNKQ